MKKLLLLAALISGVLFTALASSEKNVNNYKSDTECVCGDIYTVSVCKIVGASNAKNCNFSGRYDSETGYIVIFDKNNKQVYSGRAIKNNINKGVKGNYTHCCGDYYFNL